MKSKGVAYLLWFFLGWAGIHRFYCCKWVSGFIWLLTFGHTVRLHTAPAAFFRIVQP